MVKSLRHLFGSIAVVSLLTTVSGALAQDGRIKPGDEATAQIKRMGLKWPKPASPRSEMPIEGPFDRLVIRGVTLIDGTGAPPVGPVDVVIEQDRITRVVSVGNPGVPISPSRRPAKGNKEIDASGMYLLPGFIDSHSHIGNPGWGRTGDMPPMDYIFGLWLSHGVTTLREVSCGLGADYTLKERDRALSGESLGPRLLPHCAFPRQMPTPKQAIDWVRGLKQRGADGVKFFGGRPEVLEAAIKETRKLDMGSAFHHAQLSVTRVNAMDSARWGLKSMEHWYGLPEALFQDRIVQDYPLDYNYNNEQDRFGEAGRLWKQAAPRGSEKWNAVLEEMLALDFTLSPTFTIYEANRDVMRARKADWHETYALPSVWRFFQPNRVLHGSFHFDWTTEDEIEWKENFRIWMSFVNDYKNRGGRVTVGSDSGFIFKLFGFDYIREFELFQEAGFHPLEVIRSATLHGAELIGREKDLGTVEPGKIADLVLIDENPIKNFKVLYGTGHMKLNDETGNVERVGGVKYTILGGAIIDSEAIRANLRKMVQDEKDAETKTGKAGM